VGKTLALVMPFVVACGGGGGGSPTVPPTPPPPTTIQFTSSVAPADNAVLLVNEGGSTATLLRLQVRAKQITSLYGVSFDLLYPSAALGYVKVEEGTFLAGGQTSLQVAEPSPGRLVIGLTRLGAAGGVTGSGLLLTIEFASAAGGSGTFSFDKSKAFGPTGATIAGTEFVGGSVTVP